jgi:hypothetical protein
VLIMNRSSAPARIAVQSALGLGTFTVGTLDILDAIIFYGQRGVPAVTILQSIASGLLGRVAYSGGLQTALIGAALHYFIAFCVVGTLLAAARLWRGLAGLPWLVGPLYGVGVYLVMNFVVVPLSAAVVGKPTLPAVINGLAIHIAGVGLPSALFARAATPPEPQDT